ncbi:AI-2E family transporter [Fundicoccus culcitae]|uniref:AI-2E family transporter n=1 Tax=Fundicoccus culcitae TaxID=2969821 RepID=A0ABY5P5X2_9LACT|nr:AI-2E family transporter [Fundicoccus culcitae]UUX34136.1 AI-2E family transporter [Fundicoccus culcitae]
MKKNEKITIFNIVLVMIGLLIIIHWSTIIGYIGVIWTVIFPVILGGMIAFVINLLMKRIENILYPNYKNKLAEVTRRPLAILLSFAIILLVISVIVMLVVPQLISAVSTLVDVLPEVVANLVSWLEGQEDLIPIINEYTSNIDWQSILSDIISAGNEVFQRIASSSVSILTTSVSAVTNIVLALMFSLYILMSKEKLGQQFNDMLEAYLPTGVRNLVLNIFTLMNYIFSKFISGTVIEAVILGLLVTIGLSILQIPYATMLGVLQGTLAFIPMIGAFVAGAVGFIILLSVSPTQAVVFLIFVIIVQQLEGDFIYPRVVGDSIGLPGMWVLFAVTIGGGLFGITGMLIGVPTVATIYSLIEIDIRYRKQVKKSLVNDNRLDKNKTEIKLLNPLRKELLTATEIKALQ